MRGKTAPSVCVLVLNYNNYADTLQCLRSLRETTYPNFRVFVVDNGSVGPDVECINAEFGDSVSIVRLAQNVGFARGFNAGIRLALDASHEFVLVLNNDTKVHPQFLDALVREAMSAKNVGIAGPKILYYDQPGVIWHAGGAFDPKTGISRSRGLNEHDRGQYDYPAFVQGVSGCCMLFTRRFLQSAGLFDEQFFFGYEEHDINMRAWQAGFSVLFVPSAVIWHKVSRTIRSVVSSGYWSSYMEALGYLRFLRKHFGLAGTLRIVATRTLLDRYSQLMVSTTRYPFVLRPYLDALLTMATRSRYVPFYARTHRSSNPEQGLELD